MQRRDFIKGVVTVAAVAALPQMTLSAEPDVFYLRRGEKLAGKTFTRPITVYMEEDTCIDGCQFYNDQCPMLRVECWNGGDPSKRLIQNCFFGRPSRPRHKVGV